MASEIRVDKINSLSGVGTVTLSPTGVDIAGITTAATLRATTGIVTSLTAGSLTSLGAVSGTTGTFTSTVKSGTTATGTIFSVGDSGNSGDRVIQFKRAATTNDINIQAINSGSGGTNLLFNQEGGAASFGGAISATTGTFTGDVDIASSLVHTGDTDTKLTFTTDNISLTTGGTTRVNVTSSGNLEMPNDNDYLKIGASGDLALVHNGSASYVQNSTGFLQLQSDGIRFDNASGTERARVDSSGNFIVGGTSLGVADSFGVQPTGHFRHISASGSTGDTLLGAIDGVSNGFQVNISGTNVQKYKFHNGSTQTVQIDSDGLKFMNDTAAANALDDYEEGTWSPQIYYQNSTNQSDSTNNASYGWYTKIGNLVTVSFFLRWSLTGSPANDNNGVKNFPFTNSTITSTYGNAGAVAIISHSGTNLASDATIIFKWQNDNSTIGLFELPDSTSNLGNEMGANTGMRAWACFSYRTS